MAPTVKETEKLDPRKQQSMKERLALALKDDLLILSVHGLGAWVELLSSRCLNRA